MKRPAVKPKPRRQKQKKTRLATQPTGSQAADRKIGFGTAVSSHFRGIGLRKGEEIPEFHGMKLQIPNFEE